MIDTRATISSPYHREHKEAADDYNGEIAMCRCGGFFPTEEMHSRIEGLMCLDCSEAVDWFLLKATA